MFTIKQRIWTHHAPPEQTDYYGAMRWVVSDNDGFVHDHYGCEAAAKDAVRELEETLAADYRTCPHCGGLI